MTVAACPRCQDEITIPSRGRPESRVQCPLCLEEMRLEEVLARVPPMLVLLDEEDRAPAWSGDEQSAAATAGGGWASDEGAGDYAVAGDESSSNEFMGGGIGAATTTMGSPTATIAAGKVRAKKQPNLIAEMVKMVMGGVGGLTLGVLVLWWLPGQYATDIAGIGPTVANYVPMIVPEKFRGKKSPGTPTPNNASNNNNTPAQTPENKPPANNGNNKKPNGNKPNTTGISTNGNNSDLPSDLPADPNDPLAVVDPLATPADPNDPLAVVDPLAVPADPNDPLAVVDPLAMPKDPNDPLGVNDPLATSVPGEEPTNPAVNPATNPEPVDRLANPAPEPMPEPSPTPEPAPEPMPEPAVNDNATRLAEFVTAGQEAALAFDTADAKDVLKRRELGTKLFEAASQIGAAAAKVDARDSAVAPTLEAMPAYLKSISDSPGKISMIGFLAAQKLDDARGGDGILCAGTVKDIRAAGKVFEVELSLASSDKRPVLVIARENPQDVIKVDQKILVPGMIVDDPDKSIKGYEGSPGIVVLSGYLMPVE